MIQAIRRTLPLLFAVTALGAHAQFYHHFTDTLKGGSISVGGTGHFTTPLTSNPNNVAVPSRIGNTNAFTTTTASNQQQYTTKSAGFITSMQFHPVAWAGVELNYGFTHYSERYLFNYANASAVQRASVSTDQHEFTGAYTFHPPHIPFQPFVNVGGGAIDFAPRNASSQIRGAGLLEAGFDIPTKNKHLAFRVEGRSLYYRAPNFYTPAISTRGWRVSTEPSFSSVYRF